MPSFFKIGQMILKKNILNIVNVFSPLRNYLPLGKGIFLHLNNNEYPLPKIALFGCFVEISTVVLEIEEDFVNVFLLFRNYFPLEKSVPRHLNKLESPSPKDALAQWF